MHDYQTIEVIKPDIGHGGMVLRPMHSIHSTEKFFNVAKTQGNTSYEIIQVKESSFFFLPQVLLYL